MGQKTILIQGKPKDMKKYYFYCPDCGALWYEKGYRVIQWSYCPTAGCIKLGQVMHRQEAEHLIKQKNIVTEVPEYPTNNEWLSYVCDIQDSAFPDLPNEWRI